MKKEHMKKQYPHWCGVLLLYLMACISSCQDDKISSSGYDRNPVLTVPVKTSGHKNHREVSVLSSISTVRTSETTHQKFILL